MHSILTSLFLNLLSESISLWLEPPFLPEAIAVLVYWTHRTSNPFVLDTRKLIHATIIAAKIGMTSYTVVTSFQ